MRDEFSNERYQALAEFRYQVRRFLRFSDQAARSADLEPQQHQLLLAIRAAAPDSLTVGDIAEQLQIRHHSAVELISRAETRGLVTRTRATEDLRRVFVGLTDEGATALAELSAAHHRELLTAAPELIRILQQITGDDPSSP